MPETDIVCKQLVQQMWSLYCVWHHREARTEVLECTFYPVHSGLCQGMLQEIIPATEFLNVFEVLSRFCIKYVPNDLWLFHFE